MGANTVQGAKGVAAQLVGAPRTSAQWQQQQNTDVEWSFEYKGMNGDRYDALVEADETVLGISMLHI